MVGCGKNGFAVVDWVLLAAVVLIGVVILIPYTVSEKQDKSIQICVKNLREIDKAMRIWQLDKGKPPETAVTFAEIASYLANGVSTNCPSGGQYVVTGLTNPPSCTIPGHVLANEGE